jgi:hypothetical protein
MIHLKFWDCIKNVAPIPISNSYGSCATYDIYDGLNSESSSWTYLNLFFFVTYRADNFAKSVCFYSWDLICYF